MSGMSRFYPVRCGRTVKEQRYIRARLDLWEKLPKDERQAIRDQIWKIAQGGVERSALEAVVIRGVNPRVAAERYQLDKGRVYQMQRAFLEGFQLWD